MKALIKKIEHFYNSSCNAGQILFGVFGMMLLFYILSSILPQNIMKIALSATIIAGIYFSFKQRENKGYAILESIGLIGVGLLWLSF